MAAPTAHAQQQDLLHLEGLEEALARYMMGLVVEEAATS